MDCDHDTCDAQKIHFGLLGSWGQREQMGLAMVLGGTSHGPRGEQGPFRAFWIDINSAK
jgi:hypothetical protein